LIVIGIVVLVAVVLARGRRVSRQPGAFRGVIRVTGGEVPGLGMKWRRGYGCWVREILVWTTAPFLCREELVVADAAAGAARAADPGEVRCLGRACGDCGAGRRRRRAGWGRCFGRWA
jgi:hypothetical protein